MHSAGVPTCQTQGPPNIGLLGDGATFLESYPCHLKERTLFSEESSHHVARPPDAPTAPPDPHLPRFIGHLGAPLNENNGSSISK